MKLFAVLRMSKDIGMWIWSIIYLSEKKEMCEAIVQGFMDRNPDTSPDYFKSRFRIEEVETEKPIDFDEMIRW